MTWNICCYYYYHVTCTITYYYYYRITWTIYCYYYYHVTCTITYYYYNRVTWTIYCYYYYHVTCTITYYYYNRVTWTIYYNVLLPPVKPYAQERHQRSGENTTEIHEMYPRSSWAAKCRSPEVTSYSNTGRPQILCRHVVYSKSYTIRLTAVWKIWDLLCCSLKPEKTIWTLYNVEQLQNYVLHCFLIVQLLAGTNCH